MSQVEPLIFFRIVADRHLNPGAALLDLGAGDAESLLPLLAEEEFSSLARAFPCLIGSALAERLGPELLSAFLNAGCHTVMEGAVHHSDAPTKPEVPGTARWLTGTWHLASPLRTSPNKAASRALALKLLKLVAADADTRDIESIFRQDPVLAYHLLRLVNSLGVGVGRHIASFSQAILILGRQQLKRWLNLMLFAANRDDYRATMLMAQVSVRARSMELLAKAGGYDRSVQDQAFMAGMFSLLDILFGMPLADILNPLKLSESMTMAVLRHEGELGSLLRAVVLMEQADDKALTHTLETALLTAAGHNRLVVEAHGWVLSVIREKRDGGDV